MFNYLKILKNKKYNERELKDIGENSSFIVCIFSFVMIFFIGVVSDEIFNQVGLFFVLLFFLSLIVVGMVSSSLNHKLFIRNFIIKLFISVSIMSLSVPIANFNKEIVLNNQELQEFNKYLNHIVDISNKDITENLSLTDKEEYQKNINIIKEKYQKINFPLKAKDLYIVKKIEKHLKILENKVIINLETKELENNSLEIIKNLK